MNQPPDDNFYNSSTENTKLPPQQWQGQAPGYPQRPQSAPNNYPPGPGPQNFPPRGPLSQPGMGPQNFPQQSPQGQPGIAPGPQNQAGFGPQRGPGYPQPQGQGPVSQPGFGPPNVAQGPVSQPGFGPSNVAQGPVSQPGFSGPNASTVAGFGTQNYAPPGPGQQRGLGYPPPSGPISQPGFSAAGYPQQERYTPQQPPWLGNNPQSGNPAPAWEQQQFNAAARPQQPNGPTNLADPALSQGAARPKTNKLWLAIVLVLLAIVVIGGGTFVLFTHKGNNPVSTLTTQGTSTTNGVTPVATKPTSTPTASNASHSIGTPVQAGAEWIVTITGVKETTSSLFAPNAGNTYLEVSLTLKNISGNTLPLVSIIEFTLVDGSGHRYSETATDTNIHNPADGNVNSNQTLAAQIAYEVPKNQHTFTLTFAYGLHDNNGASISWQFTV